MAFLVDVVPINPDCGCDGMITYSWSGGTNPVRFIVKLNGNVIQDISFSTSSGSYAVFVSGSPTLCEGVYSIQANNGGVPTYLQTFTLVAPIPISINTSQSTDAPCNGQGYINFSFTGGFSPYYINIHQGSFCGQGTIVFSAVQTTLQTFSIPVTPTFPGINFYNIHISGSNGNGTGSSDCVTCAQVNILQLPCPNPCNNLLGTITVTSGTCYDNGSITTVVSGGTGPFTYLWTGPFGFSSTSQNLDSLISGTYILVITDSTGCTWTGSVILTNPDQLNATGATVDPTCNGNDGEISLIITGGTPGYTFSWTGPDGYTSTDQDITGLTFGQYTVFITDANECSSGFLFILQQPCCGLGSDVLDGVFIQACGGTSSSFVDVPTLGTGVTYTIIYTITGLTSGTAGVSGVGWSDTQSTNGTFTYTFTAVDSFVTAFINNTGSGCVTVNGISPVISIPCNKCWKLSKCDVPQVFFLVTTDLSTYNGKILNGIQIPGFTIDPDTCWLVTQENNCLSTNILVSFNTYFSTCEICKEVCLIPEPIPHFVDYPVKNFTQVRESQCDIDIKQSFSLGYYSLFKTAKYGVTDCCKTFDLESLWLSNEIQNNNMLIIPGFTCHHTFPCHHCRQNPCHCHLSPAPFCE